jgi:hypothetical protein
VASQSGAICKDAPITDEGVVTNVRVCHEEVLITDLGYHPPAGGSRLKGHALANDVTVTDDQLARLTTILEILRDRAHRRELKDRVSIPDRRPTIEHNVRTYGIIATEHHVWSDN